VACLILLMAEIAAGLDVLDIDRKEDLKGASQQRLADLLPALDAELAAC
jgi:hypothetical protein